MNYRTIPFKYITQHADSMIYGSFREPWSKSEEISSKSIDYIVGTSPLLKGLECHLLVSEGTKYFDAEQKLQEVRFKVIIKKEDNSNINQGISSYVIDNKNL